jgi:hypothetical protein
MAVCALNNTNATGESTLSVEPVRLSNAGGQALVRKHLQLTMPCDVNYFVHRLALGCHPKQPSQEGCSVMLSAVTRYWRRSPA